MDKQKIIIVDDEEDILEFVAYNLQKEGFDVQTYTSGDALLHDAEIISFDLLILDIMMPGQTGIEVCAKLRMMSKHQDSLITFLTARGEDDMQIEALDEGGDDFIQKPVPPKVLIARIKSLLKRSKHGENKQTLKFGDFLIDKNAMIVVKENQKIDLVKKEFQLLYLLASQPGKVFTRHEILTQVWGTDVIVGDRTIDVHVRKLREKIGADFIRTMKGVGYKFEF